MVYQDVCTMMIILPLLLVVKEWKIMDFHRCVLLDML